MPSKEELRRQGRSRHTVQAYVSHVQSFLTWVGERCGETDPAAIIVFDVRDYQSYCLSEKNILLPALNKGFWPSGNTATFWWPPNACQAIRKEVQPVRAPKRSAPDVLSRSELNQLCPEVYKGGDPRDIATFERLLQAVSAVPSSFISKKETTSAKVALGEAPFSLTHCITPYLKQAAPSAGDGVSVL